MEGLQLLTADWPSLLEMEMQTQKLQSERLLLLLFSTGTTLQLAAIVTCPVAFCTDSVSLIDHILQI